MDVVRVSAMGAPVNRSPRAQARASNRIGVFRTDEFNFQDWTSLRITNSITHPAEAAFELGDDTGWERLNNLCDLGAEFAISVNDRPRIRGRVEAITAPADARSGMVQSFVIRTKMSDAAYSSAPQGIRLKGASIKEFVLACYEGIGLTEKDFDFQADASRDLMTGKDSKGQRPEKPLDQLKAEQAKVNPPETIFAAVDRHLRRHGLLHWDGGDGRIVVAAPDDTVEPMATLVSRRPPNGQYNNILSIERTRDVSQSPTVLAVFGVGGSADFSATKVSSLLYNQDLITRGFRRNVVIIDEALKTKAIAGSRANREFATRNRGLDRITITVDGLSYREAGERLPWSPDTTVDVYTEQLGGAIGTYYVEDVEISRSASASDITRLTLVKQGVWVL